MRFTLMYPPPLHARDFQELAKGHHDKVEAFLDRALALSIDIGDPITRVSECTEQSVHVSYSLR